KGHESGSCTFAKYEDGTIGYDRPGLRVPGVPKHTEWKARKEKASQAAQRFKKSIEEANRKNNETRVQPHYGKEHGQGWILTATDGHRALFERGQGIGKAENGLNFTETGFPHYEEAFCDDPELHLAVKRALVMASERDNKIRLVIENGNLS